MRSRTAWVVLSLVVVLGLLTSSTAGLADTRQPPGPNNPATGFFPPSPVVGPTQSTPNNGLPEQVNCTQAIAQGVDKQLNMRAALIRVQCGLEPPGVTTAEELQPSPATATNANDYGSTDVLVNNASADTFPHVTQSETFIAANANIVIVAYNSSTGAPGNYSGISYSTDNAGSFTEIRPSPFATGHGTNFGDPVALYNSKYGTWFTVWISAGGDCGAQGLGSWNSSNGINWSVGTCVHVGTADDRESGWADNNPSSPYYGNMYISWNDFSTTNDNLVVSVSSNGGSSWSAPVTVFSSSFMRDVQMTGGQDGVVFIAGMDEGGGAANPRHNYIFSSSNGGASWSSAISMGAPFQAPGDFQCTSYFRAVTPIWRFMGYGQPAVGPGGVVHYVYTAGAGSDTGDTYYVRSADNGNTWSTPLKLNTDATTRTQWMPSLAVTVNGKLMASWYDRRNTSNNDYQRYARVSLDNGLTWQTDQPISDQVIPQPEQPDPNVNACYAGDYDYSSATGQTIYSAWTDGRGQIASVNQQDVYLDKVNFGAASIPVCTAVGAYGWSAVAALPTAVYGPGVTADANFVYAAGGYNIGTGVTDQFVRYSPVTNTWTPLMPMPTPALETLAVYAQGKVYVFGGLDNSLSTSFNNTRIYDRATNLWSAGAPMPDVRSFLGGGYYNGKIYVVGGYTTGSVVDAQSQNWAYDILSNTWSTLASLPVALGGAASQVVGNHLFIIGGRNSGSFNLNTVYDYSILADTWTPRAPMLSGINVPGSAVYQGKIWVMGGGTPFLSASQTVPDAVQAQPQAVETTNITQIYDPATNSWSTGPSQLYPRSFQGAATVQGVIVSVGGFDGDSSAVTEVPIQRPLRILIAYADPAAPGTLQNALLAQPGVALVDMFNATTATPSLALLKTYDMVAVFSNPPFSDSITLGNNLADYVDAGGVVVELNFGFYNPGYSIGGRWDSGGYTPFTNGASLNFANATWTRTTSPTNALLFGVNKLASYYRSNAVLAPGATQLAQWSDALPLLAYKGRAVGINAYIGQYPPNWSGDYTRLIINAGFSLRPKRIICSQMHLPELARNH